MPLSLKAQASKDRTIKSGTGYCAMQHRHFATIAAIIRCMPEGRGRYEVEMHFGRELGCTNPAFNRQRFAAACRP